MLKEKERKLSYHKYQDWVSNHLFGKQTALEELHTQMQLPSLRISVLQLRLGIKYIDSMRLRFSDH